MSNRIKPDGPNLKPTECPYCNNAIDRASGILREQPPEPGDVCICLYCGEASKFNDQLQIEKLDELELIEMKTDPIVQAARLSIEARKAVTDPDRQRAYSDQLDKMSGDVVDWRVNHRDSNPMIQYNFQKGVAVIVALQDAIDNNFVSVNDDALQMFKEIGWLDDGPAMPTVLMVRVVLEHVFGKE